MTRVPPAKEVGVGFMTCNAASHQGAVRSSIFIYNQCWEHCCSSCKTLLLVVNTFFIMLIHILGPGALVAGQLDLEETCRGIEGGGG